MISVEFEILYYKYIYSIMTDWIENICSAWLGHRKFAEWLISYMKPSVVVELGVDYGYSSFVFANAIKNSGCNGVVYGIDNFNGDINAGFRNTFDFVMENKNSHNLDCLEIIVDDFTNASLKWTKSIDILHIDGLHTYEAVKGDYENWSKYVNNNGVILFHDVTAFSDTVGRFFNEINDGYKTFFVHSAGLGIITKNRELFESILSYRDNYISKS